MNPIKVPNDIESVLNAGWESVRNLPGFLLEQEARFLGLIAACAPKGGAILEIGSFKGKSTVMLAKVAEHYGLGPVVAIDPHNFNSPELGAHRTDANATSFDEFSKNLETARVSHLVEVHRAYSSDVAPTWNRPISFLWIDGDHGYQGAKSDFDGFSGYVVPEGVVAFHDALHEFSGPIRVFVEDVLRSDRFGAAGFVHSIAWAQYRPEDGAAFRAQRAALEGVAEPLIPFVRDDRPLHGLRKLSYKLRRARVPRSLLPSAEWAALLNRG